MEFSLTSQFPGTDREWNDLLAAGITHVPFLRAEYLRAWWLTRGGGEWEDAELALVSARESDHLVGIAPLFSTQVDGIASLLLLGSVEISDYLDLIVSPADLPGFLPALLDHLAASPEVPPWRRLDWHNLPENSPTLPLLAAEAQRRGWRYTQEQTYHAPVIPLPGDFDAYLTGTDKKQRHEIRRKMRRAAEAGGVRWYIHDDGATLDAAVEDFFTLMAGAPDKAFFLSPAMRQQMHLACRAAFENGWLQLAFLEVDGTKAAAYLNFDYLNRIWVYNSGVDVRFLELSPGWVLLGHLLEWANANRRKDFDFMRGDESYKYRFGAVDHFVMHARVER